MFMSKLPEELEKFEFLEGDRVSFVICKNSYHFDL